MTTFLTATPACTLPCQPLIYSAFFPPALPFPPKTMRVLWIASVTEDQPCFPSQTYQMLKKPQGCSASTLVSKLKWGKEVPQKRLILEETSLSWQKNGIIYVWSVLCRALGCFLSWMFKQTWKMIACFCIQSPYANLVAWMNNMVNPQQVKNRKSEKKKKCYSVCVYFAFSPSTCGTHPTKPVDSGSIQ